MSRRNAGGGTTLPWVTAPASAVCAGAVIFLKEIINILRFNRMDAGGSAILYLPPDPLSFFVRSLLLVLLVAAAIGLVEAIVLYGIRAMQRRLFGRLPAAKQLFCSAACLSGALLPIIVPVAVRLFQGKGISRQWYAPYGPWAAALIGYSLALFLTWGGLLWHQRLRERRSSPLFFLSCLVPALAGVSLLAIDGRFYPGLYEYLHDLLLLLSLFSFQFSALLLFEATRIFRFAPARRAAALLVVAVFCAAAFLPGGYSASAERRYLSAGTNYLRRTVHRVRSLLDLDRDGYSAVLGGGDCNDMDGSVHPFARDVPDDGIDQDCLAGDASSKSAARYELLWRREPVGAEDLLPGNPYSGFNVLVICVDALRGDRLLNRERYAKLLPNLYALAGEGVSFSKAFSPGSGTGTSLPVALTSRYGAPGAPSLFEILGENGYTTLLATMGKVTGTFFPGEYVDPFRGIDSERIIGTEDGVTAGWSITSDMITEGAVELLERHGGDKFALYVHYFDLHDAPWISDGRIAAAGRSLERRYDAAAALVDGEVGRLLAELEERGIMERTIVVLFGDHGEGLADKGVYFHTSYAFNSLVHVPLLIRLPSRAGPDVLTEPVGLVDLTPTVLSLLGIETVTRFDGESLLPLMRGTEAARSKPLLVNEVKQKAVIMGRHKLLVTPGMNLLELYDLRNDFGETRNIAEEKKGRTRELYEILMASPIAPGEAGRGTWDDPREPTPAE